MVDLIQARLIVPEILKPTDAWPGGPKRLILLGPPGTGKTRAALSHWMLPAFKSGIPAESILSCSFTRAAAGELRERIAKETGRDEASMRGSCSTIHSEGYRLLGLKRGKLKLVGGDDRASKEWAFEETGKIHGKSLQEKAIAAWDFARGMAITDVNSPEFSEFVWKHSVGLDPNQARTYILQYEAAKRQKGEIDFPDMLVHSLEIEAPKRRLLVVDEAQDCSRLQWKLVEHWSRAADVTVYIGDFDQTIHEWNGADATRIFGLIDEGFEVRRLEQSHRVPRRVHAVATSLIRKNRERVDAVYLPRNFEGTARRVSFGQALDALKTSGKEFTSAFVLARSGNLLGRWKEALATHSVPFKNERGGWPLGAPKAVEIARAVLDIRAGKAINRHAVLTLVNELPRRGEHDFFTDTKKAVEAKIKTRALNLRFDTAVLQEAGIRSDLLLALSIERIFHAAGLRERAKQFVDMLHVQGEHVFMDGLTPSVILTTMHGSKGREADIVVVDLEAPWPTVQSIDSGEGVESERRVLYVALTRSRMDLLVVGGGRHDMGERLGLRL